MITFEFQRNILFQHTVLIERKGPGVVLVHVGIVKVKDPIDGLVVVEEELELMANVLGGAIHDTD